MTLQLEFELSQLVLCLLQLCLVLLQQFFVVFNLLVKFGLIKQLLRVNFRSWQDVLPLHLVCKDCGIFEQQVKPNYAAYDDQRLDY